MILSCWIRSLRSAALVCAAACSTALLPADCSNAADTVMLFNGKDFSGWHGRPTVDPRKWSTTPDADKSKWNQEIADHWKVEGNEIVNDGQGAYLTTNSEYGDFDLSLAY
ncbi:MAG: family 16 glycoside hydrolase, partial [Pirellula sp.]